MNREVFDIGNITDSQMEIGIPLAGRLEPSQTLKLNGSELSTGMNRAVSKNGELLPSLGLVGLFAAEREDLTLGYYAVLVGESENLIIVGTDKPGEETYFESKAFNTLPDDRVRTLELPDFLINQSDYTGSVRIKPRVPLRIFM